MTSSSLLVALLVAALALVATLATAQPNVQLDVAADGSSYSVTVNSQVWLQSMPIWFRDGGFEASTSDGSLAYVSTETDTGFDTVGQYNDVILNWQSTYTGKQFQTRFRKYWSLLAVPESNPDPTNIRAIVFDQVWVDGGMNCSRGNVDATISAFPAFAAADQNGVDLGYVSWAGNFMWNTFGMYSGANSALVNFTSGLASGPITLFDTEAMVTTMMAPFDSFMATSIVATPTSVHWGFMGGINTIDVGSSAKTMLFFGDGGIRSTVMNWGDVMRNAYGKTHAAEKSELIVDYLGYSTDRGAYYYTTPEPGMNFEETFIALKTYTDSLDLPYKYMSLGSFWYFKNSTGMDGGGLLNWTATPGTFPHGLQAFHEMWEGPIMAHNRWFDSSTPYSSAHGGKYEFIETGTWALPVSFEFWDDFFGNATWGVKMYIQDWLITQIDMIDQLQTDQHLGRQWLLQMGLGAARHDVNIQYCMPLPRHVMQSLEIPNVVQVRATNDYVPGQTDYQNWQIGVNSMIEYSLGMAIYKDNFWTTSKQPGNMYNRSEPNPALQAYTALASTGSVAPSDRIGYANATLIMQTCRADGLLLKPDVPAMELDTNYAQLVWGQPGGAVYGPTGVVTHTYTEISGLRWLAVFSTNLTAAYKLSYDDLRLSADVDPTQLASGFLALRLYKETLDLSTLIPFDASHPIVLPQSKLYDFSVFYAAPIPANGIVLLGETDKLMLMSRARVQRLLFASKSVIVELRGLSMEKVTMSWTLPPYNAVMSIACMLDEAGVAVLTIGSDGSASC